MESNIQGTMEPLIKQLSELGKNATGIVRKALQSPLKIVQEKARQGVASAVRFRDLRGHIAASIGRKVYSARGFIVAGKVGVGVGMKNPRFRNLAGHGWRYDKAETFDQYELRAGALTGRRAAFQAHLLSLGTQDRWTGYTTRWKRGADGKKVKDAPTGHPRRYTGRIIADPYFRNVTSTVGPEAARQFEQSITTEIRKELGNG